MRCGRIAALTIGVAWLCASATLQAQASSAKAEAPFDPGGYWVSLITRDWRFRMVVPGPGAYQGIPINLAAKEFADAWKPAPDEAAGKQCEAYGAGAVMLVPGRLHITWKDDQTLQVDVDAGQQTRLLNFGPKPGSLPPPSWQGYSDASWMLHEVKALGPSAFATPGTPAAGKFGRLKVVTGNLLAGLLRKNGLPYSSQATLTEYWELHTDDAMQYLIVTTRLHDPVYLLSDYYTTATFRKEPDGSKWRPTPCTLTAMP